MVSAEPGKNQRQRGITRGKRRDDSHLPDFKRTVQGKRAARVEKTRQQAPSPGLPPGTVGQMPPTAEPAQRERKEEKSRELHVKHGAERADAMRRKARDKVSAAPG